MSFVFATPEYVAAAASDLANLGSALGSANAAALGPTSGVLAAGADEVSAGIAALFGAHAQAYQALSAQAALFHDQFVQLMSGGAAQYALTEAANASPLMAAGQGVMSGVTAPLQAVAAAPAAGATGVLAADAGGASGSFGPGGAGASGQLVSSVGTGPGAGAVGGGAGASFGPGGAGYTGSLVAGQSLGGARAAGASGGLVESVGASGIPAAAESADELGIGGYGGTPLAAVPATAPVTSPAAARPWTPAYSPATPAAGQSSEE